MNRIDEIRERLDFGNSGHRTTIGDFMALHDLIDDMCADIAYLLEQLEKRDALSLEGLQITRFEPDDVTGQEFAVYCDSEGRPRIKLCGRNQQAMSKPEVRP